MGLMLETHERGTARPSEAARTTMLPTSSQPSACSTIEREAGKQNVPFTTGLLGIGESANRWKTASKHCLLAIRDMNDRYTGHIQEVIVQNFRVKPAIPMANWPEPMRGEMLRAAWRLRSLLPNVNIQAPPFLSAPYYDDLVDGRPQRLGRRLLYLDLRLYQSREAVKSRT